MGARSGRNQGAAPSELNKRAVGARTPAGRGARDGKGEIRIYQVGRFRARGRLYPAPPYVATLSYRGGADGANPCCEVYGAMGPLGVGRFGEGGFESISPPSQREVETAAIHGR